MSSNTREQVELGLARGNGILRLEPTWVARDFLRSGRNLRLKDDEYDLGERGEISERWLGSTTLAINRIGPKDEGLSYVQLEEGVSITLRAAVESAKDLIVGQEYAKTHVGLNRLAKVFNFGDRLFYHYHQMAPDAALVGGNPKEEAYYFPPKVDLGPHPETFFGVHPYIAEQKKYDVLLPYLVNWNSDLILRETRGYTQVHDDGFHVPAGIGHAPGTAVTIELQEDSDVFSNLQALVGGKLVSKELLYHSIRPVDREQYGERIVLRQLDWELNGDPYFYENRHTPPILIKESVTVSGLEYWIFYNTRKFSGKKLVVHPGQTYLSQDEGCYNLLVWEGQGLFDGHQVEAGDSGMDELLVTFETATQPVKAENTGKEDLVIFKFFGSDINPDVPMLPKYGK
jgi:hypothetical protein